MINVIVAFCLGWVVCAIDAARALDRQERFWRLKEIKWLLGDMSRRTEETRSFVEERIEKRKRGIN